MKNKLVHYEIFMFDLSKVFKTMNIHFNPEIMHRCRVSKIIDTHSKISCKTPSRIIAS